MSDGGAQFHEFGPYFDNDGVLYRGIKINVYAAGTTNDKTYWTDEGKLSAGAHPLEDTNNDGRVSAHFDGDYRFQVKDSAGVDLDVAIDNDNFRITSDTATMWENDFGLSYPTAAAKNIWHLFAKVSAANKFLELGINEGAAFRKIADAPTGNVNVTEYGAIADYNETTGAGTDNVAAFDAAIAALDAAGGGLLWIPTGKYKMASTFAIPDDSYITISGPTFGREFDTPSASTTVNGAELHFTQTDSTHGISADWDSGSIGHFELKDITIVGNASAGVGVFLEYVRPMASLNRVGIQSFGSHGLHHDFSFEIKVEQCVIMQNAGWGIFAENGISGSNYMQNKVIQNTLGQMNLDTTSGAINIIGGEIQPVAADDVVSIRLRKVTGANILGVFSEADTAQSYSSNVIDIIGGTAEGNWAKGVTVRGCTISRSGQNAGDGRLIGIDNAHSIDVSHNSLSPGSTIISAFAISNTNVANVNTSPNIVIGVSQVQTMQLAGDPLTGNVTIYAADGNMFFLDPGGADRTVTMAATVTGIIQSFPPGHTVTFYNSATVGTDEYLTISGNSVDIAVVAPGQSVTVRYDSELAGGRNWTVLCQDAGLRTSTITVSSAELLALAATPIEVIPDPGVNKVAEFIGATLLYDYGGTAYTLNGDYDIAFRYTDGSGTIISQTVDTTGFIDQANDEVRICKALPALQDTDVTLSAAIVIDNIGGGEWTLGDGTLKVNVLWREYETGLV